MASDILGRITGKTSTSGFRFSISGSIRKWDYVKVLHKEVGPCLAQVTEIERLDHTSIADCIIIGYRNERNFLRPPRTPFEPDSNVLVAEDELISKTLGLVKNGLYIGLLEGKPAMKFYIDAERLLTRHLAILAKSGAGKSYAVGVLLEELTERGFPVLIIDPHGEYSTIKYANNYDEDLKHIREYDISPKGYLEKIKEFATNTQINTEASQLTLPMPSSAFELAEAVPFKLSQSQKALLYSALTDLRDRKPQFDLEDVASYVNLCESNAKWGLIAAIENLQKTNLFSLKPTEATELVKPGQLSIINLKGAPIELQEITVSSLACKLFEQRKLGNIPPFFLVLEEAHSFCPERGFGEARSSKIIRAIASEGRKFGLGLCVVSQRPARVDKNVLSQCSSQIILQVTNPNDLTAISSSFEGIRAETEREVQALPIGKALLLGATDFPTFVDIRIRKSSHGGRSQKISFEDVSEEEEELVDKFSGQLDPQKAKPASAKGELVYAFKPRINKKDLAMLEEKEIKESQLELYPVLCLNVKAKTKEFYLVFDLIKPQILYLDDKLYAIKLPQNISKLSPMQKKILGAAALSDKSQTVAELMFKAGMSFGEAGGVVDSLVRLGLLNANGKNIEIPSQLKAFLDLSKLNFVERADYLDLPGKKLAQKITQDEIISFIRELGIEVTNIRPGWLPVWHVLFADESMKVKDALTWSLEL